MHIQTLIESYDFACRNFGDQSDAALLLAALIREAHS